MTSQVHSHHFSCLYDQEESIGLLGRGTHYSVYRSIQWREIDGDFRDSGRFHDFSIIWDEDHDTRVIQVIEHLHMSGLLWPVVFMGERKGMLTLLLSYGIDPTKERSDWFDAVADIAGHAIKNDPWAVEFGTFHRDPANRDQLTEPVGLISDREDRVVAYLQAIDVLWQLGGKRSQHPKK